MKSGDKVLKDMGPTSYRAALLCGAEAGFEPATSDVPCSLSGIRQLSFGFRLKDGDKELKDVFLLLYQTELPAGAGLGLNQRPQ